MAQKYSLSRPYQLTFEHKPGYLLARIRGEHDSLEISRMFWTEIIEEVDKTKPKGLLVWEDLKTMVNTPEVFMLVSELCQYLQFQHIRIAYLDDHLDQMDRNKFGEMVATNRGFCVRVCSDLMEAEKWLLKS